MELAQSGNGAVYGWLLSGPGVSVAKYLFFWPGYLAIWWPGLLPSGVSIGGDVAAVERWRRSKDFYARWFSIPTYLLLGLMMASSVGRDRISEPAKKAVPVLTGSSSTVRGVAASPGRGGVNEKVAAPVKPPAEAIKVPPVYRAPVDAVKHEKQGTAVDAALDVPSLQVRAPTPEIQVRVTADSVREGAKLRFEVLVKSIETKVQYNGQDPIVRCRLGIPEHGAFNAWEPFLAQSGGREDAALELLIAAQCNRGAR